MSNEQNNLTHEQEITVQVLKNEARIVNLNDNFVREIDYYKMTERKFGHSDKRTKDTEAKLRDLLGFFAEAVNEAFPEEKPIKQSSLGLYSDILTKYKWTLIASKQETE
jgi:hypothetical protein